MKVKDDPSASRSLNPRDRAAARILRQAARFPDLDLRPLDATGLQARDAALARAIDHVVARHWITLEALIRSRIARPWERVQDDIRAALLIGAAQVFYMDGVADHAAADHAVEWTKQRRNAKAAGFVNAIMRALVRLRGGSEPPRPRERSRANTQSARSTSENSRTTNETAREDAAALAQQIVGLSASELPLPDGRTLELAEDVFSDQPSARLAQQTSHPDALIARWLKVFGEAKTGELALHSLVQPPIIVTGIDHASGVESSDQLVAHSDPAFFIYTGRHDSIGAFLDAHPGARVQDPAGAHALDLARDLAPDRIADLCAGSGTKTAQLAAMFPEARIVASDPDPARFAVLRARFRDDTRVSIIEHGGWIDHHGSFDLVLIDAPCSNTGVLARRVEAKYRYSRASLASLVELQRRIIVEALRLRRDAGCILYATCSIDPEENEKQAAWVERYHPLRRCAERAITPRGRPGDDPARYRDGGYAALLATG